MIPKFFGFKFDDNVLNAQAFGTWLYIQVGSYGLFFGSCMPFGLRAVWTRWLPGIRGRRHYAAKSKGNLA